MEPGTARARFAAARVARMATVSSGGAPHLVPCTFAVHEDVVAVAIDDVKPKRTLAVRRLEHLRANPATSLLVDHYDDDWSTLWWIRADGLARVIASGEEYERLLDLLADKYPQYRQRRPPGPVIAIAIATWRAWP